MTPHRPAFTLMELLVVIVIIFLLVTIAVVSFSGARSSANRMRSLAALRQLATGYSSYATDHNGRLMPGYLAEAEVISLDVEARLPDGTIIRSTDCVGGACDQSSWVWRLAPYLGDTWEPMYEDYLSGTLRTRLEGEFTGASPVYGPATASGTEIGISEYPSYGLNSIFLGGDSAHGGSALTNRSPWTAADPDDVLAVTRMSQVNNPSNVLLFGASQRDPDAGGPDGSEFGLRFGSPELRPPLIDRAADGTWSGDQWTLMDEEEISFDGVFSAGGGVPIARHGRGLVPIVHLDGSTAAETLERLNGRAGSTADAQRTVGIDLLMSIWAPKVIAPVASTSEN